MRRRALPLVLLALAAAVAAAAIAQAPPELPDNPLAGRLLFEEKSCVLCHGIAGDVPGVGPDLGRGAFSGSFLDLGAGLWNHVPGMSVSLEDARLPWPDLSAGEVGSLTSFLYFIDYLGRPGEAAAGRRVYRSKGCAECHALEDDRGGSGPALAGLKRFASPLYVAQAIWNHGPAMFETMRMAGVRTPEFAEGDLADLSAYVRQAAPAGPQQRVMVAPGNPNQGRELFQSKGCPICHGRDARGGVGPDLTEADLHRSAEAIAGSMWNHAESMSDAMRARGFGWPQFTTPELADLIAFLYFLPFTDPPGDATQGAQVFASRSCAECHGGGDGAHEGPDLAASGAAGTHADFVAAMWNHAPLMKESILGEGKPWPELSGGDLRDILAYLASKPGG
jgi:mono/diheme cytochrome c family protein